VACDEKVLWSEAKDIGMSGRLSRPSTKLATSICRVNVSIGCSPINSCSASVSLSFKPARTGAVGTQVLRQRLAPQTGFFNAFLKQQKKAIPTLLSKVFQKPFVTIQLFLGRETFTVKKACSRRAAEPQRRAKTF